MKSFSMEQSQLKPRIHIHDEGRLSVLLSHPFARKKANGWGTELLCGTTLFFALCALVFSCGAMQAQQSKPWEKIPTPKLHEFKPHQPQRIALKNGIVLFLQEDHELPFVSGSVLIPGGARDEDPAKTGLVGLYGQAWRTSGTAKIDGDALDDLLESKAAHIETGGDVDSTAVSWDSLKGDSEQVFSLAMDLLFHPNFSAEKLQQIGRAHV